MKRRRYSCGWFPLSPEARALILAGRCEYAELIDGPVAQAVIFGVQHRPIPIDIFAAVDVADEIEAAPDPAQTKLAL